MTNINLPIQKECTISGTLGVVLRISKIFGLAPLKFKRTRGSWCISFSPAANLFGKIIICLVCLMTVVLLILDFHAEHYSSRYFRTISDTAACIATITCITLSLLAAIYSGTHRMQCVITSLAQLQKVDDKLRQYGPLKPLKTRILFVSVGSFIGACFLFGMLYCVMCYDFGRRKANLMDLVFDASYYTEIIINKFLILQVTLILAAVPASFSHLNDCLTNLLRQIRNSNTPYKPAVTAATVNHLCTLHDSLCSVVKHIDDSHGLVLAAFVPVFLSTLVITFFKLTSYLLAANFNGCMVVMTFLIIHSSTMVLTIEPCHQTYEQMNRTKRLIGELLLFTPTEHHKVIQELETFYKHLLNDIIYTPMGIFYLTRTVNVTIVGSIITYVVIMVQP